MKKFYFLLSLLLMVVANSAQAIDVKVPTGVGDQITSADQLEAGQYILVKGGPGAAVAGRWLREGVAGLDPAPFSDARFNVPSKLFLTQGDIDFSNAETAAPYLFQIESVEETDTPDGGAEAAVIAVIKTAGGRYFPNFVEDQATWGQWSKWMGFSSEEPANITVKFFDGGSYVQFVDENGVAYDGNIGDQAQIVGWTAPADGSAGQNQHYQIFAATVESSEGAEVSIDCSDGVNLNETRTGTYLIGAQIAAPTFQYYTLKDAETDAGEKITFPYTVTTPTEEGEPLTLYLTYEAWPEFDVTCINEANGNVIETHSSVRVEKDSIYTAPTIFGFELVDPSQAQIVITGNDPIEIKYRSSEAGIPFERTTVTNGEFAPGTKFYHITINGKSLAYNKETYQVETTSETSGKYGVYNDDQQWAMTGNLNDGFKFYNKEMGATYVAVPVVGEDVEANEDGSLNYGAGGNIIQLQEEESLEDGTPYSFGIYKINDKKFSFNLVGYPNSYMNRFGGSDGIAFWTAEGNGPKTDANGAFQFEEVTDEVVYPFVPAKVVDGKLADDTQYYFMKVRGGYVVSEGANKDLLVQNNLNAPDEEALNANLWAFVVTEDEGIQIVNKNMGLGYLMCPSDGTDANNTYIQILDEETYSADEFAHSYDLSRYDVNYSEAKGVRYCLAVHGSPNACLNRFGGNTGPKLAIWNNAGSPGDVGSCFEFIAPEKQFVDSLLNAFAEAEKVRKAKEISLLSQWTKSVGCVAGFSASDVTALDAAVKANDYEATIAAAAALREKVTTDIEIDPAQKYNIVSAEPGYTNVMLYVKPGTADEDGVVVDSLSWKTFADGNDAAAQWELVPFADEEAADGTLVPTYLIKNGDNVVCSYRFSADTQAAVMVPYDPTKTEFADLLDDDGNVTQGGMANFSLNQNLGQLKEGSETEYSFQGIPGSFFVKHNYSASIVTMALANSAQGMAGAGWPTEGNVVSYNTNTGLFGNSFRFFAVGSYDAINGAVVAQPQGADKAYDLSGRRVQKAQKGIYIIGGKKVVVK